MSEAETLVARLSFNTWCWTLASSTRHFLLTKSQQEETAFSSKCIWFLLIINSKKSKTAITSSNINDECKNGATTDD